MEQPSWWTWQSRRDLQTLSQVIHRETFRPDSLTCVFIYALYFPGDGPLTVFAPTNEAIEALPADLVSSLMEDTEMLKQVLLFHVVAGEITSSMADNNIQLPSVAGPPLLVNLYLKSKYYDVSGNKSFFV